MKFCKKCNIETLREKDGFCSTCKKIYSAKYRAENPEKVKKATSTWRLKNKGKPNIAAKEWRKANPEKEKNTMIKWRKANPGAKRIHEQNRRAKKKNNGGKLSKGLREKLFKLQKGMCPCCKPRKKLPHLIKDQHLDHIIPLSKGGLNVDSNIQLLCASCNLEKHAKDPIDFMQSRGFLI